MLRLATPDDARQIAEIYKPYVEMTTVTFETTAPTVQEMQSRIERISENFPWIVMEENGSILGYAYASRHHERAAYNWAVDTSIYVRQDYRGRNIGKTLYTALFYILKAQGYYNAYAAIALPNEPSVRIHEHFGFQKIAHFNKAGFKLGQWIDVGWFELFLREHDSKPEEPVPIKNLDSEFLEQILKC